MTQFQVSEKQEASAGARLLAWLGRVILAIIIPVIAFGVIYAGFIWLRESDAPKWLVALVAIVCFIYYGPYNNKYTSSRSVFSIRDNS